MKHARRIIFFIMCATLFWGCQPKFVQYELMQERGQIVSIQIAEGIGEKDAFEGNYDRLKVIVSIPEEQWELFFANFQSVQCLQYRNDPCQSVEGNVIWITYANGAIELIGDCATFYHWVGEENRGNFRPYYFDLEQFNSLIAQYVEGE